jgi:hypothetical protein
MKRASLAQLRKRWEYLQVDDVLYFARNQNQPELLALRVLAHNDEIRKVAKKHFKLPDLEEYGLKAMLFQLQREYKEFREEHHKEPKWFRHVTEPMRHWLRSDYLMFNGEVEPLYLFPQLPFSGIGYHIWEYGFSWRIHDAFNLGRLAQIKQLGYLYPPINEGEETYVTTLEFPQHRLTHMFDVRAIGKLILINNGILPDTPEGKLDHVLNDTAGLTHDVRTPAGGDSIKGIDPFEFDEDLHYYKTLETIDRSNLPEFTPEVMELLPKVIMNEGKIGAVLDIADKVAYLCRDLQAFYHYQMTTEARMWIDEILRAQPLVCSVWETVRIDGDVVYFTDKDRLVKWLELRCLMFRHLYQNPRARFWEQFVKTIVSERMYKTGALTANQLRSMTDLQLSMLLWEEVGFNYPPSMLWGTFKEKREGFETWEDANACQQQLRKEGIVISMIEKSFINLKTGDKFLIKTRKGIMPLKDADPCVSAHLQSLIQPENNFTLHYLNVPREEIPPKLQDWITS